MTVTHERGKDGFSPSCGNHSGMPKWEVQPVLGVLGDGSCWLLALKPEGVECKFWVSIIRQEARSATG